MRQAFVTGGTGFVGLNLIDELLRSGWMVTTLHRPNSDLSLLKRFQARLVVGDLNNRASLIAAIPNNTDTLFHVAGNTNMWRRHNAEQTRDNIEGTREVIEAAIARGVRRLIVTSSLSAYGCINGEITETTPSLANHSWINYQKTKWEAQELALAAIPRGLEVVVMQPGVILGPYDINSWSRLFLKVRDAKLQGVPASLLSCAHVREVVRAHITAADKGQNGSSYLLAGTNVTLIQLVDEISRLLCKSHSTPIIPAWQFKTIARLYQWISVFTNKEPQVTPELATMLTIHPYTKSEKAQRELGYQIVPLATMVKDCYDWMKTENRI